MILNKSEQFFPPEPRNRLLLQGQLKGTGKKRLTPFFVGFEITLLSIAFWPKLSKDVLSIEKSFLLIQRLEITGPG